MLAPARICAAVAQSVAEIAAMYAIVLESGAHQHLESLQDIDQVSGTNMLTADDPGEEQSPARGSICVCPIVETAGGGQGGSELRNSKSDGHDEERADGPLYKSARDKREEVTGWKGTYTPYDSNRPAIRESKAKYRPAAVVTSMSGASVYYACTEIDGELTQWQGMGK